MEHRCGNFLVSSIDLNDYLENDRSHSYFKGIIWSIEKMNSKNACLRITSQWIKICMCIQHVDTHSNLPAKWKIIHELHIHSLFHHIKCVQKLSVTNSLKAQTVKDYESLSRVMSISIQLSVTNSFKTQTVKDPESLSRAMSIGIQLSVTNSFKTQTVKDHESLSRAMSICIQLSLPKLLWCLIFSLVSIFMDKLIVRCLLKFELVVLKLTHKLSTYICLSWWLLKPTNIIQIIPILSYLPLTLFLHLWSKI